MKRLRLAVLYLCAGLLMAQTAKYPSAIATDADLKVAKNRVQTTLRGAIGAGDTLITVADSTGIVAHSLITIDAEILSVTSVAGNNLTVVRGFDNTTAAAHSTGRAVAQLVAAWHHNALAAEVKAIETTLGVNLSNVTAMPGFLSSTSYDFAAQSPGGSLTAAIVNVITMTPCPLGVNGTDTGHYLYLSGGVGTAESILISGGTCTSGLATGTLTFTPTYNHSGAWTIRSATAGIVEAGTAGKAVLVPAGTHTLYGPLVITSPGVWIKGVGVNATILNASATTGSIVEFQSSGVVTFVGGGVSDLTIAGAAGTTSEIGIYFNGTATAEWADTRVNNVNVSGVAHGIKSNYHISSSFTNFNIGATKPSTGIGIDLLSGHDRYFHNCVVYDSAGNEGLAAVRLNSRAIGDFFEQCDFMGHADGVLIAPTDLGAGTYDKTASWGHFTDVYLDSLTNCGVRFNPAATTTADLFQFNNVWTSTVLYGVCVEGAGATSNITFHGGRIRAASRHGFYLTKGSNIAIKDALISSNSLAGAGTYHGIYASNVIQLSVVGNTIGAPAGETQGYGLYLTGTTDGLEVVGNLFNGNVTGTIFDDTTLGDKWVAANRGVDNLAQTIASAATITPGAAQFVVLTGTTQVTTITAAPNFQGRTIYLTPTDAAPAQPTLRHGGNIAQSIYLAQNQTAACTYNSTTSLWHCFKQSSGPTQISDGGTKPTCDAWTRGTIWRDDGGAGVADTAEICDKDKADVYGWRSVDWPYKIAELSLTAQNAAIATTNLLATAPAGTYRVTAYLQTTTQSTGACTSALTLGWTYNGSAKTGTPITGHSHAVDETFSQGTYTIRSQAAANITYAVDLTAGGGDCSNAVYDLYASLERLQ